MRSRLVSADLTGERGEAMLTWAIVGVVAVVGWRFAVSKGWLPR